MPKSRSHPRPRVRSLELKDFKSIQHCRIALGPLTLLIGRNGAGKSNLLDALHFVGDAVSNTLSYALRNRGGIHEVRRRAAKGRGRPHNVSFSIELVLADGRRADFAFELAGAAGKKFTVKREQCRVFQPREASGATDQQLSLFDEGAS